MSVDEEGADLLIGAIGEFREELIQWIDAQLAQLRERDMRLGVVDEEQVAGLRRQAAPSEHEPPAAFQDQGDLEVVETADTLRRARAVMATTSPDVVVLESRLPDGSAIAAVPDLRRAFPASKVVLLTSGSDPAVAAEAVKQPDVEKKLQDLTTDPVGNSPDEAREFLTQEKKRWDQVIRAANIKPE